MPIAMKPFAVLILLMGALPTRADIAVAMTSLRAQIGQEQRHNPGDRLPADSTAYPMASYAPWQQATLEGRQRSKRFLTGRSQYLSDPCFIEDWGETIVISITDESTQGMGA